MQSKFVSDHQVDLLVPRVPTSYHDRTEHLSLVGIIRVLSDYYVESESKGFFTGRFRQENMRGFTVQENIVCSPRLHRKASERDGVLLHRISFASIGETSYTIAQDLLDPSSMEQLLHLEAKIVNVNPETRRPSKLPVWVTERFLNFCKRDSSSMLTKQEDIVPPSNAFKTLIRTRPSDMDSNFHVHFAEFYRFCTDCASEASLNGHYRYYEDDMCWFPVLETEVTFLGESPANVNLDVYSWQDTVHVQRIYFAIYLKNNRIFQASFLYSKEKSPIESVSKL
ncbi:uncharacterized protein LOC110442628 [Mizuhopecten yessoensis]|nr:uncharacterized protein LOC110442628 [Mizuhopecten yessoensis]